MENPKGKDIDFISIIKEQGIEKVLNLTLFFNI